jgi:hypothetical protein
MFELFYIYMLSNRWNEITEKNIYQDRSNEKNSNILLQKKMKNRNFINLACLAAFQQKNNFFN